MSLNKFQSLRRSQFILTYGPGSIIETKYGPRLIPALNTGIYNFTNLANENEIHDVRLTNLINNKNKNEGFEVKLFNLPSNNNKGYKTFIFPVWKICYNHEVPILFDSSDENLNGCCPSCHQSEYSKNNKIGSVRFILACVNGHMDDVPWDFAVHNGSGCGSNYFEWKVNDSSLSGITVKCPKCGAEANLLEIVKDRYYHCTGKILENSRPGSGNVSYMQGVRVQNCDQNNFVKGIKRGMKIVQRQSTSLRFPNNFTILTIPPYDDNFSRIVQTKEVKTYLMDMLNADNDEEKNLLLKVLFKNHDPSDILKKRYNENPEEFFRIIKNLLKEDVSLDDIINEEFNTLKADKNECSVNFMKKRVNSGNPFEIDFNNKSFPLKVFSIDKIKTVTAQYGYQRNPKPKKNDDGEIIPSETVFIGKKDNEDNCIWYPAFEGIGEGIFIMSNQNPLEYLSSENEALNDWVLKRPIHNIMQQTGLDVKDPLFVWWHTLSHAIIKSLSYVSGYSSSAIRERIYYNESGEGGILLYTTSAGEDCGMGGLIESTNNFDEILSQAMEYIMHCSNDPLCEEQRISKNRVNGSACINCLFLSETSCGYSNMWLDRHLLLGD